ncbi:hypothetical protein Droror1_Dr00017727 [Drosera rotundifolia]
MVDSGWFGCRGVGVGVNPASFVAEVIEAVITAIGCGLDSGVGFEWGDCELSGWIVLWSGSAAGSAWIGSGRGIPTDIVTVWLTCVYAKNAAAARRGLWMKIAGFETTSYPVFGDWCSEIGVFGLLWHYGGGIAGELRRRLVCLGQRIPMSLDWCFGVVKFGNGVSVASDERVCVCSFEVSRGVSGGQGLNGETVN